MKLLKLERLNRQMPQHFMFFEKIDNESFIAILLVAYGHQYFKELEQVFYTSDCGGYITWISVKEEKFYQPFYVWPDVSVGQHFSTG